MPREASRLGGTVQVARQVKVYIIKGSFFRIEIFDVRKTKKSPGSLKGSQGKPREGLKRLREAPREFREDQVGPREGVGKAWTVLTDFFVDGKGD